MCRVWRGTVSGTAAQLPWNPEQAHPPFFGRFKIYSNGQASTPLPFCHFQLHLPGRGTQTANLCTFNKRFPWTHRCALFCHSGFSVAILNFDLWLSKDRHPLKTWGIILQYRGWGGNLLGIKRLTVRTIWSKTLWNTIIHLSKNIFANLQ